MKKMTKTILMVLLMATAAKAEVKFLTPVTSAGYSGLPDFAYVEASAPLSRADRASITVAQLKKYDQEQLDQLYARLTSGPIPRGDYRGSVLLKHPTMQKLTGEVMKKVTSTGLMGFFAKIALGGLCLSEDRAECIGEFLWSGKRFYDPNEFGEVQLRNAISPKLKMGILLKKAGLGALAKPLENFPPQDFDGQKRLMMFPANVYCGLSLYDTRRESIIIDYAYGDDFKPYIPQIDGLVGRDGAWIRDEIRMIRPGLYLGRAYMDRIFLVNFVLENEDVASKIGADGNAKKSGGGFFGLFKGKQPEIDVESMWKGSCWGTNSWQ